MQTQAMVTRKPRVLPPTLHSTARPDSWSWSEFSHSSTPQQQAFYHRPEVYYGARAALQQPLAGGYAAKHPPEAVGYAHGRQPEATGYERRHQPQAFVYVPGHQPEVVDYAHWHRPEATGYERRQPPEAGGLFYRGADFDQHALSIQREKVSARAGFCPAGWPSNGETVLQSSSRYIQRLRQLSAVHRWTTAGERSGVEEQDRGGHPDDRPAMPHAGLPVVGHHPHSPERRAVGSLSRPSYQNLLGSHVGGGWGDDGALAGLASWVTEASASSFSPGIYPPLPPPPPRGPSFVRRAASSDQHSRGSSVRDVPNVHLPPAAVREISIEGNPVRHLPPSPPLLHSHHEPYHQDNTLAIGTRVVQTESRRGDGERGETIQRSKSSSYYDDKRQRCYLPLGYSSTLDSSGGGVGEPQLQNSGAEGRQPFSNFTPIPLALRGIPAPPAASGSPAKGGATGQVSVPGPMKERRAATRRKKKTTKAAATNTTSPWLSGSTSVASSTLRKEAQPRGGDSVPSSSSYREMPVALAANAQARGIGGGGGGGCGGEGGGGAADAAAPSSAANDKFKLAQFLTTATTDHRYAPVILRKLIDVIIKGETRKGADQPSCSCDSDSRDEKQALKQAEKSAAGLGLSSNTGCPRPAASSPTSARPPSSCEQHQAASSTADIYEQQPAIGASMPAFPDVDAAAGVRTPTTAAPVGSSGGGGSSVNSNSTSSDSGRRTSSEGGQLEPKVKDEETRYWDTKAAQCDVDVMKRSYLGYRGDPPPPPPVEGVKTGLAGSTTAAEDDHHQSSLQGEEVEEGRVGSAARTQQNLNACVENATPLTTPRETLAPGVTAEAAPAKRRCPFNPRDCAVIPKPPGRAVAKPSPSTSTSFSLHSVHPPCGQADREAAPGSSGQDHLRKPSSGKPASAGGSHSACTSPYSGRKARHVSTHVERGNRLTISSSTPGNLDPGKLDAPFAQRRRDLRLETGAVCNRFPGCPLTLQNVAAEVRNSDFDRDTSSECSQPAPSLGSAGRGNGGGNSRGESGRETWSGSRGLSGSPSAGRNESKKWRTSNSLVSDGKEDDSRKRRASDSPSDCQGGVKRQRPSDSPCRHPDEFRNSSFSHSSSNGTGASRKRKPSDCSSDCKDVSRKRKPSDCSSDCKDESTKRSPRDCSSDCKDVSRKRSPRDCSSDCKDVSRIRKPSDCSSDCKDESTKRRSSDCSSDPKDVSRKRRPNDSSSDCKDEFKRRRPSGSPSKYSDVFRNDTDESRKRKTSDSSSHGKEESRQQRTNCGDLRESSTQRPADFSRSCDFSCNSTVESQTQRPAGCSSHGRDESRKKKADYSSSGVTSDSRKGRRGDSPSSHPESRKHKTSESRKQNTSTSKPQEHRSNGARKSIPAEFKGPDSMDEGESIASHSSMTFAGSAPVSWKKQASDSPTRNEPCPSDSEEHSNVLNPLNCFHDRASGGVQSLFAALARRDGITGEFARPSHDKNRSPSDENKTSSRVQSSASSSRIQGVSGSAQERSAFTDTTRNPHSLSDSVETLGPAIIDCAKKRSPCAWSSASNEAHLEAATTYARHSARAVETESRRFHEFPQKQARDVPKQCHKSAGRSVTSDCSANTSAVKFRSETCTRAAADAARQPVKTGDHSQPSQDVCQPVVVVLEKLDGQSPARGKVHIRDGKLTEADRSSEKTGSSCDETEPAAESSVAEKPKATTGFFFCFCDSCDTVFVNKAIHDHHKCVRWLDSSSDEAGKGVSKTANTRGTRSGDGDADYNADDNDNDNDDDEADTEQYPGRQHHRRCPSDDDCNTSETSSDSDDDDNDWYDERYGAKLGDNGGPQRKRLLRPNGGNGTRFKSHKTLTTDPRRGVAGKVKDTGPRGAPRMFDCVQCDQSFSSKGGLLFHWQHMHKKIASR